MQNLIVVALAGLPGTGKSTLALALARELRAPVFDKDRIREALYGPDHVEYTREQDDFCVRLAYSAVEREAARARARAVILDGRTYSQPDQIDALVALAQRCRAILALIECVASRERVRARLKRSARRKHGGHPAADRNFARYLELERAAVPITIEKLVLDTTQADPRTQARIALAWIESRAAAVR